MKLFLFILAVFTEDEFKKLQEGNTKYIERLYNTYKNRIYNYLLNILNNNEHDAYDILSDTFEVVITTVVRLKNQNNLGGWLIAIAGNLVKGHHKKFKMRQHILEYAKIKEPHYSPDIIVELDKNYQYSLLMSAYERLNPLYKKIFELRYFESKKIKEIAGVLDKTEDSVASTLKRMKKKLKATIEQYYLT